MTTLRTIATRALKHSGQGHWHADGRVVVGAIDEGHRKSFTVAAIDMEDELPVCAGEAIARYVEAVHPSVVIGLLDEIERLTAIVNGGCGRCAEFTADHFDDASVGADDEQNQSVAPA